MITKVSNVDVMGSELWRMARSFLKEKTSANITMCDVQGQFAQLRHNLCRMISFLENGVGHESPKEFVISDGKVFTNTFDRIPVGEFEMSFRREKMTERKKVAIRSSNNRNMLPFYAVPALSQSPYTKQDYNISIKEVLLCSQKLLFHPYDITPIRQHWEPENDAGHEVLCCEFSGLFERGEKQIEVIGCCLKSIMSNVQVKRACVCLKSVVKNYEIGMFYTMTVAMSFADLIERKSSVFVIYDENYKNISEQLCHLLHQKLCTTYSAEFDSSKDIQHPTATALIILSKHIICSLDVINRCFPMLKHLLSVRGLLSFSVYAAHPTRDKTIETSFIDLYEIFKETSMQTTFFHVKRCLAKAKYQCKIDNQDCVLNFAAVKPTVPLKVPKQMLIRHDSAYVVIGGLSGLGWEIMKFLASQKAKIVISMSRRSPSPTVKYRLENLQLLRNTEVWHVNADITDRKNLENAFFDLEHRLAETPLRGIFHGAGVLHDAPVEKLTLDMFDKPLMPKIVGTLNLHHVTKHLELDYFLLHSSVVSLLGNGSQTNYAAGNSFMDAFAHYRRSIGHPAQVINWGLLNVGMGADQNIQSIMGADQNIQSINALNGLFPISTAQITSSLMHALLMNRTQLMVADIDVSIGGIKFEDLQSPRVSSKLQENHNVVNLLQRESQSREDLLDIWIRFVKMSSASVLSVESDEIKESSILLDYGLNSQKAIELVNYLFSHSQIRLPVVYLITGKNTVKAIAEYFLNKAIQTNDTSNEEYVSFSPSYLEQHYFDLLEENENNPHLAIMVDLTISGSLNDKESWKIAALNLIMMNPELRTVFKSTEHGQKRGNRMRLVLDIEDINLQFENVNTEEDLEKTSEKLRKFNPNEDIPVRFVYWQSTHFGCLRLIFNHCAFDNGSVSILAKDLEMIMKYTIAKHTIPDSMVRRAVDPALIMEQNLAGEMENLQSYWKTELLTCNEKHSFTSLSRPDTNCDLEKDLVLSKNCDEKLVMKLEEYAKERKVSLFSLFCTAYQLTLNAFLMNKRVCVINATDMRMHFPELLERAVLCVNYIPLVSPELSANRSIHDIAQDNSERIAVSLSKSNLPFKLMKGMSEFKKSVHSVHMINLEDLTLWNRFDTTSVEMTKFKAEQDTTFETCLSIIIHSERNIELKLQVSTENVGKYNGESILENIERLIYMMPFKSVLHMHDITSTSGIEQEIGNLSSASFTFLNGKGDRKFKTVHILHSPTFTLEWGRKRKIQIPVINIQRIQGFQFEDLYGISLTLPQSDVKLALKNRRARDAWIAVLEKNLSELNFGTSAVTRL
ncbi:uncharacterized protein LOC125678558 isoform X2 [Ostrea edulis]|uniref:uncharacterized protein LOC125678558 isoform X2 n=1 Tax=Ostrea edulis TaxID=37623 RepID=UPI0024AF5B7D|nr:uncharacterized protein LOC125678558 isoform X2 [Ostrea edulis]